MPIMRACYSQRVVIAGSIILDELHLHLCSDATS